MNDIVMARPVDAEAELDRLAKRYRAASGIGMRLLNVLGSRAENLRIAVQAEVAAVERRRLAEAYELRDHIERGRQKLHNMRQKRDAGPAPGAGPRGARG